MAGLNFKYGLEQSLQTTDLNEGTIYITTDKHSMYCDLKPQGTETVKRFRIGDFLRYNSLDELKDNHDLWNRNSLVYIDNGNVLAAYDETEKRWIQINDTSTLSNALTERINGLERRIETIEDNYTTQEDLEAEKSARENADDVFNSRIQTLENKTADFEEGTTIKGYIDGQIGSINNSETGILAQAKKYTDDEIVEATNTINSTITGLEADIEAIDEKVNKETQDRENAISKEVTDRDAAIASAISKEETDRDSAIAAANTALAGQISGQITELDEKIDKEIEDRGKAISTLETTTINPLANRVSNLENVTSGFTGTGAISTAISTAETSAKNHANALVTALIDNAQTINTFKKVEDEFVLVRSEVKTQMQTADAMTFKGIVDGFNGLPTGAEIDENGNAILINAGDTYKVAYAKNYIVGDSTIQYVGDLLIAKEDQSENTNIYTGGWYHISSGYEDDYNAYFIGSDNNNKLELKGGAGEDKGSITFVSDNIQISMTSSTNELTGVNNSELAFSLVWGTF